MSSFEEQVLSGTYGKKKKKNEESFEQQVLNGTYEEPKIQKKVSKPTKNEINDNINNITNTAMFNVQSAFKSLSSSKDENVNVNMFRKTKNNSFAERTLDKLKQKSNRVKELETQMPLLQQSIQKSNNNNEKWNLTQQYLKLQREHNELTDKPLDEKIKHIGGSLLRNGINAYQNFVPSPVKVKVKKEGDINFLKTGANALVEAGKGITDFSENVFDAGIQFASSNDNPFMHLINDDKNLGEKIKGAGGALLRNGYNMYQNFVPGPNIKISTEPDKSIKARQDIAKEIIEQDASQKFIDETLGYNKKLSNGKTVQETLDENSLIKSNNIGGQIARQVGQQLPSMIFGAGSGETASLGTMAISSYGSGVEEAYKNGATREQAHNYGLMNAGIETATEKMFAGVGGVIGKGELDDVFKEGIKKKIKSELGKKIADYGLDMIGEGVEEVASDLLNPIAKKLTYAKKEDLIKMYKDENYFQDFLMGALSSGVMKGMSLPADISVINQNRIQNIAPVNSEMKNNTQINKNNINIQELEQNSINDQQVLETPQNRAQDKQIAPVRTDINQENVANENTTTQNETQLVEKLKEIREQTTNKKEQAKLDNHIQQIENDVKNLSDNSKTFAQDNKTIGDNTQQENTNIKNKQLAIINETNPMQDNYHTGIRNIDDIKTFEEAFFEDGEYSGMDPDFTEAMAKQALQDGKITIYSSYPIKNGVFVSPSKMEAQQYAGGDANKLYSKEVNINDVAWIDGAEGQYAKVKDNNTIMELTDKLMEKYEGGGSRNQLEIDALRKSIKESGIKNPIIISSETGKIIDGNHRLKIANELGIKDVPVKYVKSSNEIDLDNKEWYDYLQGELHGKRKSITSANERMQNESINNRRSNKVGKGIQSSRQSDKLPSRKQTNNNKSSVKTIHGTNSTMGEELKNSSFSNEKIAPVKETKSDNIPMVKSNDNVKQIKYSKPDYKKIADSINNKSNTKERSWLETSLESKSLKEYQPELIKGLKDENLTYEVQSNKSTLEKANKKLSSMSYEDAVSYIDGKIYDEKNMTLTDIALTERLIQEASKKGDYQTASDLIQDLAILGTDMGQKVQALSLIKRLTPEGQLSMYQKIVKRAKARGEYSFDNVEITPEMVEKILSVYHEDGTYDQNELNAKVEEFKQDIAKQMKTTVGEKIDSWRYLSMLGNPKTHIRNIVSNVAMRGTIKVKNAMARSFETVLPIKQENRTKTFKRPSNEVKQYAKQTALEMKDIIRGEAKYNEKTQLEANKKIFKNKALEGVSNFNSNALEAEDWFFSKRAFQDTFEEYLTAQGIRTKQDIENNTKIIEKAKQYSVEQAEIATFRQYSKLASMINQFERKSKGGKLAIEALIPFKKTPINVAKAGVNYSPLGLIKDVTYNVYQLKEGNINGSQFVDNLSQGMTGTSLALLGYALAKAGILSGSGGDDKDDKYDKQLGKQGYAINLGGKFYSISWLSPTAMPMLVGANAYEQLEEGKEWDMNVVSDSLAKTLDPLNEMSFMSGLTNALNSYGSGTDKLKGSLESTAQNYVGQFFPTLFSQIASVTDDTKRSTQASNNSKYKFGEQTIRSIMYKVPGLRQKLEPATDIWGNDKKQSDGILERAFESFLSPYSKTEDKTTDLDRELKRVYSETGDTTVIPGIPYGYTRYQNETYRMSAKEYTKYKKKYGQAANNYLNELINTDSYQYASDEMKAKMIEKIYKYVRAEANEQYFKNTDVEYTSDELKELKELKNIGISNKSFSEYVADKTQISSIRSSSNYSTEEKRSKISDIFTSSNLNNKQLSYLYGKYYSTEEKLKALNSVDMPIKQFIKYDLQEFKSDYNSKGKSVRGSRQNKVMNYINNLNLSVPQKALLIKMEYNSFNSYNKQIESYINSSNGDFLDKAYLIKQSGFKGYDKQIINYVFNNYSTSEERGDVLKKLGFTVRNGRVY